MAVAGDTILGTTTSDPNFYTRKAAALGDALSGAFAGAQARREQQQQREMDEIQTFYKMALEQPELAVSMGDAYKAKYGQKYPMLPHLIDILQNKAKTVASIDAAGSTYYANQQSLEQKYAADQAALAQMPDQVEVRVPVPSFGMAGPRAAALAGGDAHMGEISLPMPNVDKATKQAQMSQVQPAFIPHLAAMMMTPEERHKAQIAGAYTFHEPELFGKDSDLPPDQRALAMATAGYFGMDPNSDSYAAARIGAKLQQSPAKLQEQGYDTSERKAKESADAESDAAKAQAALERQRESDKLSRGRMGLADTIEQGHIAQRAATGGGRGAKTKPLWQVAMSESEASIKGWQQDSNAAVADLSRGSEAVDARRKFTQANPRPAKLTTEAAAKIEQKVKSAVAAGHISPENAPLAVARLVEAFSQLTGAQRKTSKEALAIILSDAGPPPAPEPLPAFAGATATGSVAVP